MTTKMPSRISADFEERFPGGSAKATECAMTLVWTSDLLIKRIAELLQPFDLTPTSGLVLGILADSEEPLPPNQIADRLILTRATVTGLLDSLEKRGHVKRRPHPSDRRMLLVELTDSGREIAGEFRLVVHRRQKMWLAVLGGQEQDQLIEMLQRLQGSLMDFEE